MTEQEIINNVTLLSLVIKVDALIEILPTEQKLSYNVEVQRQKNIKLDAFLTQYDISPEQQQAFRTLFEEVRF